MISLDTNVLVRTLVQDDPVQTRLAEKLLRDTAERGETCLITHPVLCELEWVLDSNYQAGRSEILAAIQRLLRNPLFELEERSVVQRALDSYADGRADFSDHLIGVMSEARGARTTYTFDRALRNQEGFVLLR